MQKQFLLMAALLLSSMVMAQEITFETTKIDYGTLERGADGVRLFKFTNSGNAPLVISNAKQSCGCTIPSWPKEPILPGESSEIKVKYDTNRLGAFSKYVTITSNDAKNSTIRLAINGTIIEEPAATPAREKTAFDH